MNHTIDIKADSLPWPFKLVGVLLMIAALATMAGAYWWLSFLFFLLGLIILTVKSGTEINHDTKTYREYNSILFFRYGETEKYEGVEKIFINASKTVKQRTTAHTSHGSIYEGIEYNAYLKFADGKKIFLASREDKTALINKMRPVAAHLQTELVDHSS